MWIQPNQAKEFAKEALKELAEESKKHTDTNIGRVEQILVIGLDDKAKRDIDKLRAKHPTVKNYGVLVRRVLANAAKGD